MNAMSSLIRLMIGLALIMASYTTYQNTIVKAVPGAKLALFGMVTDLSPGQATMGLVVVGLIGAAFVGIGVLGLLKGRQ